MAARIAFSEVLGTVRRICRMLHNVASLDRAGVSGAPVSHAIHRFVCVVAVRLSESCCLSGDFWPK